MTDNDHFLEVTELAGDDVSQEQIERLSHRYHWALPFCEDQDVVEIACGSGQGLGLLGSRAKSLVGGDYSEGMLELAKETYGETFPLLQFDAQDMPFENNSKDVLIIFEALYYIPSPEAFLEECVRVLRPGGKVLVANANKDLFDFNPSPYSHTYHGAAELDALFGKYGFENNFYGYAELGEPTVRQSVIRFAKKIAVALKLIPKTMGGKKLLKRLVFGTLKKMPKRIEESKQADYQEPSPIKPEPNNDFKVIYCVATRRT